MPFANVNAGHAIADARKKRFGAIAARINSPQRHRLGIPVGNLKAGTIIHMDVRDATRFPAEAEQAHFICYNAECRGKRWETKKALLADHPDNRTLAQQEETHVFVGVCEMPAVEAVAPEMKDGKVTKAGREATPAVVMLLSDEE